MKISQILNNVQNIVVDGNLKLNYAGFYLYGLSLLFKDKLSYSFKFENVNDKEHSFAFIIYTLSCKQWKVIVDFHDSKNIDEKALKWCDIYAKINKNEVYFNSFFNTENAFLKKKIITIPPSFGIRVFGFIDTCKFLLRAILHYNSHTSHTIKNALRAYIKRKPLSYYNLYAKDSNFLFFIGAIWNKLDTQTVTKQRAMFIRALKRISIDRNLHFEGGLVNIGYDCDFIEDISEIMYREKKISIKEYLKNTQLSLLAFNNPAVAGCHGWKIAEFVAMRKAIISFPLMNEIYPELIHGKDIIFVNNENDVYNAIAYLLDNPLKRRELENNSRSLWENYYNPKSVILHIIENVLK